MLKVRLCRDGRENLRCYCSRIFLSRRSSTLYRRSYFAENVCWSLSDLFVAVNKPNLTVTGEVSAEIPSSTFVSI